MSLALIILAAGKGTRMESDLAKVLHPLCGKPLVIWALESAAQLQPERVVVVVGHQAQSVQDRVLEVFPHTEFATQSEMLGTGHAVQQCEEVLRNFHGDIIVTCGDVPLLQSETLQNLVQSRRKNGAAASLLVATVEDAGSYGRVIRDDNGVVEKIVEAKDANETEKQCRDVNAGTYCFESAALWRELAKIGNSNASGEYYLTDVIGLLTSNGELVVSVDVSEREMTGINTRAQLQQLEAEMNAANDVGGAR
jgi:UDP-N-acetylglucosamine diphosphorylase/glucosamine-1-phosphate N-acetyltransferase